MNRRTFLGALAAVAALPKALFAGRPKCRCGEPLMVCPVHYSETERLIFQSYHGPAWNEPSYIVGIAAEPLDAGDLVVWEYPSPGLPLIRKSRDDSDFSAHVLGRNAGVCFDSQRTGGKVKAQTSGQMHVKAL